jgi:hypothetical protein
LLNSKYETFKEGFGVVIQLNIKHVHLHAPLPDFQLALHGYAETAQWQLRVE